MELHVFQRLINMNIFSLFSCRSDKNVLGYAYELFNTISQFCIHAFLCCKHRGRFQFCQELFRVSHQNRCPGRLSNVVPARAGELPIGKFGMRNDFFLINPKSAFTNPRSFGSGATPRLFYGKTMIVWSRLDGIESDCQPKVAGQRCSVIQQLRRCYYSYRLKDAFLVSFDDFPVAP